MLIDQADLLEGMDWFFVQEFMAITVRENFAKGDFIFHEGDKADYFHTLIEGCVRLSIGREEKEVYIVSHAGEGFGWSGLLDRNYYSACAECLEPTRTHKIERKALDQVLQKHPENSSIFYKRIANTLGHRLIECYKLLYLQTQPTLKTG
jgi:CRP-like cAMP-binding protein